MPVRKSGRQSGRSQRGVALLTAVLATALAATIAYAMVVSGEQATLRAEAANRSAQARLLARGLEDYALAGLLRDLESSPGLDHLNERWASMIPPLPYERGQIRARAEDLDGRFNINQLARPDGSIDVAMQNVFVRLLESQGLDRKLAAAVKDWIDADNMPELGGAEDLDYLRGSPSYRAPNRPLLDPIELRGVQGLDELGLRKLLPYLSALPRNLNDGGVQVINVNTASWPVLAAIAPELPQSKLEQWRARGTPWRTSDDVQKDFTEAGLSFPIEYLNRIGFVSHFFIAKAEVEIDGTSYQYTSLLERQAGVLAVRWRRRG